MGELLARSPTAAADVVTRVSITFDPARSVHRLRRPDDAVAEVAGR